MNLSTLPKIELHLHLDGSINPMTASKILNCSVNDIVKELTVSDNCRDLNEYLTKFSLPEQILQTKENLSLIAENLALDLKKENVIYAEIRFAPMKHLKEGLTKEEVVDSILEGLKKVDIQTNLILCMMRGAPYEENLEVITLAKKYLHRGVCAIDLAGAEALYKTEDYRSLFALAKKENIPFTIHAGEADGKESIKSAISFDPKRIGHGVRIIEAPELIPIIKKKNILLEICPTSNIQTSIFKTYQDHPIKKLYDEFVPLSINTDNRTVSNTTLTEEYHHLITNLNMSIQDIININKTTILHTFLNSNEQDKLLKKYTELSDKWLKEQNKD